jgi:hypothetical protein
MGANNKDHSNIVAVDATNGRCPIVTFRVMSPALAAPYLITLTICEWKRMAEQIADAALALSA